MRSEILAFIEREGLSEYGRAEWINNDKNKWNAWLPVNVPQVKEKRNKHMLTIIYIHVIKLSVPICGRYY